MATARKRRALGVLTSGGDAPGMNAAVRAVTRTALARGVDVFAIHEGYQGMVSGGEAIRPLTWESVGGILQQGGTVIGTARCDAFRTRPGRLAAAENLLIREIDALVVIGGDGSLTGADTLREEWPGLLAELVASERVSKARAARHAHLTIVGLVGSIDNDMHGTDMTIGAVTALHRITEAMDALVSTAASHQRTFVVEVMGRRCGYLAVAASLAAGADWILIPEDPPDVEDWEETMCDRLRAGREAGRRDSIVVVAEGATDRAGRPISPAYVKQVLEERLGEDVRETILGHVQRGGAPSAFDRWSATVLGHAAVETLLADETRGQARLIGIRENRVTNLSLVDCVAETRRTAEALDAHDYDTVLGLRSERFREGWDIARTLVRALPHPPVEGKPRRRLAVMNAGSPAPGMNPATRVAVRLGLDRGHTVLGVQNGVRGLAAGEIRELEWMSVDNWVHHGGSHLGTNRTLPTGAELYAIARSLEEHAVDGLLVIGGATGYQTAHRLHAERANYPAFDLPIVCMPAAITNNLPGSETSVGSDTALNSIVRAVDAIKQSAVASQRAFIVEVMGYYCGYLALMSGLATGAERVYLPEEGVTLRDLAEDVQHLVQGFENGKRLGLIIRNEMAHPIYDTAFMRALFEEEGGTRFDVRSAVLGHLQQGGDPSPFDRILATRLAAACIDWLDERTAAPGGAGAFVGVRRGRLEVFDLEDLPRMFDAGLERPQDQWWMALRPIARLLAQPGPPPRA